MSTLPLRKEPGYPLNRRVGGLHSPPEGKNQWEDKQKHIRQIYNVSNYNITIKQEIPKWHHTITR
jgi:hypothetical protein